MNLEALVLVADDDPFNLRLLQEVCEASGYRVATAADGEQALRAVARERPDLILLDVAMPVMDGFEVLRILQEDPTTVSIPVVVVTASGDVESRSKGIALGATDYITKPFRVFEVQQRMRNALKLGAIARGGGRSDEELIDALTHAGTTRQLLITLDYEFTRAQRYGHALACIVARIVNYRSIVDASGDDMGDGAIVQLANGLRACIRSIDHLFRTDREEFVVLLPETDAVGARVVVDRAHRESSSPSMWGASIVPAPVLRTGLAVFPESKASSADALLREAYLVLSS